MNDGYRRVIRARRLAAEGADEIATLRAKLAEAERERDDLSRRLQRLNVAVQADRTLRVDGDAKLVSDLDALAAKLKRVEALRAHAFAPEPGMKPMIPIELLGEALSDDG